MSFPRRWESRLSWIPVFTGMTKNLPLTCPAEARRAKEDNLQK